MNQPAPEQQRVRLITAGRHNTPLYVHCGTILPIWTPEHLHTPPAGLTGTALQEWFDERANRRKRSSALPVTAVTDTEYCCDGMITLSIKQLDNHQRNAYGTTAWATDYAGRNPVEGVNGMIKNDGSLNRASCRVFGVAAHTLAALMAAVIHNLKQTRRAPPT